MKYLKLFENWNESESGDYKFYDNVTYELAAKILEDNYKKEKFTDQEIKKIEEALKKYLRTDILKLKLEYYLSNDKVDMFFIEVDRSDIYNEWNTMYCYMEKFEDNQFLLTFSGFPLPDDENPLGLIIKGRFNEDYFGYLINGLEKLDVWANEASPINDRIETYKCLTSEFLKINDNITYGKLKNYTGGLDSDVIMKITQTYPSIRDHRRREIYLYKDNKHWGTINISLKSNLYFLDIEDLRILLKLAPKTIIYGRDSKGKEISSYPNAFGQGGFKTIEELLDMPSL